MHPVKLANAVVLVFLLCPLTAGLAQIPSIEDQLNPPAFVQVPFEQANENLRAGIECALSRQSHQTTSINLGSGSVEVSVLGSVIGDYAGVSVVLIPTGSGTLVRITSPVRSQQQLQMAASDAERRASCSNR